MTPGAASLIPKEGQTVKETLHLTKPQQEKIQTRADDGLPITHKHKQTFRFIYIHYPKRWIYDLQRGFLPDITKIIGRPGLCNVRRDGNMSMALAQVREKGGTILDPKDERLGPYMDYVHFYPIRGGGKYYVDFNKAATVLPNDEIIWNKSELRDSWYDFLLHVRGTSLVRPMIREMYLAIREKEQDKLNGLLSRFDRNPHLKKRIELAEARLAGMDKHWQEYSKAFSPKTTAKPRTPGKKVEKNHER